MSGGQPEAAAAGQAGPGSASGWQGSQWQSQGDGSLSPRRLRQLSFKDTHDWKQSRATGPSLQVVVPYKPCSGTTRLAPLPLGCPSRAVNARLSASARPATEHGEARRPSTPQA